MMRLLSFMLSALLALPLWAAEIAVQPGAGTLATAIAGATPGDVLYLSSGRYAGAVVIDRSVTITGSHDAVIDGLKDGTVVLIDATDVRIKGVTVTGSGMDSQALDAGIKIARKADRAVIEGNRILGNLHGVDVHGGRDAVVRGNTIVGTQQARRNDRGNGIYVWNSPGVLVEGNSVRYGRDGIFSNTTRKAVFRNNLFRDLRFAVHYMYTNDSEVSGNVSIGNQLGFAIMFSNRAVVKDNISLSDISHGVMLNFANNADVSGNVVRGRTDRCTFIYNAHKNLIYDNWFEGCTIGIHFTAGSERNVLTGNAFVGNQTQVKYVGTRDIEWSFEGRGNYWSDHASFDLGRDGIADSPFRPNDLMDHILWSQPSAKLLIGAPAVQLVRWAQSSFPATLPGGVVDSFPLMTIAPPDIPPQYLEMEAEAATRLNERTTDDFDINDLASH